VTIGRAGVLPARLCPSHPSPEYIVSNRTRRGEPRQQQPPAINSLEFAAWLTAIYAVDAGALTAEARAQYEMAFEQAAAGHMIQAVTGIAADPIDMEEAADIEAQQALADNQLRITEISEIAMNHLDIAAQAVREDWSLVKTYHAVNEREAVA
jgi:hypothetical protein